MDHPCFAPLGNGSAVFTSRIMEDREVAHARRRSVRRSGRNPATARYGARIRSAGEVSAASFGLASSVGCRAFSKSFETAAQYGHMCHPAITAPTPLGLAATGSPDGPSNRRNEAASSIYQSQAAASSHHLSPGGTCACLLWWGPFPAGRACPRDATCNWGSCGHFPSFAHSRASWKISKC